MNQTNTEKLTQEEIHKRAIFELDQLKSEKTRCAVQALIYADKITHEASKLKEMIDIVDFKPETLRSDHLGWITQYSVNYQEWIVKGEAITNTIKNLEYVIKAIRGDDTQ